MNKETLLKTVSLIREYNEDLFKQLRVINKIQKGKSKVRKEISIDQIQEVLILISILLSGNIKCRYDLEEFIKDNKAFCDLSTIKSISTNCKQDIDALKAASFSIVEILKSMRMKEDEERYKEKVV